MLETLDARLAQAQAGQLGHAMKMIYVAGATALLIATLAACGPSAPSPTPTGTAATRSATGGVELHVIGGQYYARQEACLGLQAHDAIARLHADLFFMSTTALTDGKCLHRSRRATTRPSSQG